MKTWTKVVAVVVSACGTAQGAPLDLRQVSGDATWLVHLDVDAMRESTLMENAYLAGSRQWTRLESCLKTACEEVGVDPRLDLHGITAFGTKLGSLEGVAIVHADMHPNTMVQRAKEEPGYRSVRYDDGSASEYEIHSWSDGRETVTGAFYQPSLLVVARTEDEVRRALDVLNGKAECLKTKRCPVDAEGQAGTMLVGWAEGLAKSPLPFQSPAIKKSRSLDVLVGENRGEVFAAAHLALDTADTAKNVRAVLEGARSAAELQYEGDSSMISIIKRLKISLSDVTVSGELRAPADELWNQLKRVMAGLHESAR